MTPGNLDALRALLTSEPRVRISLVGNGQVIKPKVWTRLTVAGEDAFTLIRGESEIDLQLYFDFGTKTAPWPVEQRAKTWQTMIRRVDGTAEGNVSSRDARPLPAIYNQAIRYVVVNFTTEPDVPLTFDVWHDATRDITLREVVLKLLVVRPENP